MPKVIITNVSPSVDGEYDMSESERFTGHQLHLIKRVAGLRLGEISEAIDAKDWDMYVCIAVIALWNAGKVDNKNAYAAADMILACNPDCIDFVDDAEVGIDAGPPELTPTESEPPTGSVSGSDDSSSTGDDHQVMSLVSTGSPL